MLQFRQMLSVVTRLGGLGEASVRGLAHAHEQLGAPDQRRGPL